MSRLADLSDAAYLASIKADLVVLADGIYNRDPCLSNNISRVMLHDDLALLDRRREVVRLKSLGWTDGWLCRAGYPEAYVV